MVAYHELYAGKNAYCFQRKSKPITPASLNIHTPAHFHGRGSQEENGLQLELSLIMLIVVSFQVSQTNVLRS